MAFSAQGSPEYTAAFSNLLTQVNRLFRYVPYYEKWLALRASNPAIGNRQSEHDHIEFPRVMHVGRTEWTDRKRICRQ